MPIREFPICLGLGSVCSFHKAATTTLTFYQQLMPPKVFQERRGEGTSSC